ncbi:hypothetical protein G6F56_009724 [Rhizopus delemar]|uniref:Uncharacterized protein n=1 Tax=Rhizopus stolonifer TaxID=4846 RepID=A0A367IL14_RHIST|nr:hypothetical protein G6F56_009724 [Rhizopus delemar]RCH78374.1 hypothetical protein CU098_004515 [Rhizopus stolonifer]
MGIQDLVDSLNQSAGIESPLEIKKPKNNTVVISKTFPPSPATSPKAHHTPILKPVTKAPITHTPKTYTPTPKTYTPAPKTYTPAPKTYTPSTVETIQKSILDPNSPKNQTTFNVLTNEILGLYQDLLDQYNDSQQYIQKLETSEREHSVRIDSLTEQLRRASAEKSYFEQELKNSSVAPLSPAFSQEQLNKSDTFLADLVHVYERPEEEDCDRGVQITVAKYLLEIEQKRLESKSLKEIIEKQDQLIQKLEIKTRDNGDQLLLKEQVEVQQRELESKRELVIQLTNERKKLLANHKRRSSIEMLTDKIAHLNNRPSSISSNGRGSPPLTAPPRQPLPPLPY